MKGLHLLVALSFLSNIGILAAQDRKSFDPIDLVNIKQVRDPQISPDGSMVAFVVETPMPASERRSSQIWLALSDGSAPAGAHSQPAVLRNTSPAMVSGWFFVGLSIQSREFTRQEPDAQVFRSWGQKTARIFFLRILSPVLPKSGTPNRFEQIWLISTHGGRKQMQVTDIPGGGVKKFKWSMNGKQTGVCSNRPGHQTGIRAKAPQKKIKSRSMRTTNMIASGCTTWAAQQARLVTKEDMNIDDFDWAPNGEQFLARISPTPRIDDYWRVSKIAILSAADGSTVKTLLEHAAYNRVSWSPNGPQRFVRQNLVPGTSLEFLFSITLRVPRKTVIGDSYPATLEDIVWGPGSETLTALWYRRCESGLLQSRCKLRFAHEELASKGRQSRFTLSKDGQKADVF